MTTSSPASMGGPLSETERIAEIRARLDAATPGPWRDAGDVSGIETASGESITRGDDSGYGCVYIDDADRALIASAPADLTYLLDMAEDRRARVEALKATSRRTQERLDAATAHIKGMEGQLATAREELGELLPIASPYRTTKADRDRNWLHGAWESFAARAKTARAAANRWAREADRLEEWAAKRKSEKDAGTWPPCQGCDEHPARALGLDGGDPDER